MPHRRGFTLLETLVGLSVVALVLAGIVTAALAIGRGVSDAAAYAASRAATEDFVDRLRDDATSAMAIYVPSPCAPVEAQCNEIRFYGLTGSGQQVFWGYRLVGTNVQRCTYASFDGSCTPTGNALSGVYTFTAEMLKVTDLNLPMLRFTPIDVAIEQIDPSLDTAGRVMGGNRVADVHLATLWQAFPVHLLAGGKPFRLDLITKVVTPPPTPTPTPTPTFAPTPPPTPPPTPTPTPPPPTPPPTPTPTPDACFAGSTCGVVTYQHLVACTFHYYGYGGPSGTNIWLTRYYQSTDGGSTWALVYQNSVAGGSGCTINQGGYPYAAGPPPAGDIINWSGVCNPPGYGSPISWSPSYPPAYVTNYFPSQAGCSG